MAESITDKYLLDFLEGECLDLRAITVQAGRDDADVAWVVIQHYMAAPKEREIGTGKTPRQAITAAIKNMERGLSAVAAGK